MKKEFNPDWAIHPSESVKEIMEERGISPIELAIECGIPIETVRSFLRSQIGISKEMAEKFPKKLGSTPEFWLRLSADFDEAIKVGKERVK